MAILKFEPDVPMSIALKFDAGKEVTGQYGPQIMYSLVNGSVAYVPPAVEEQRKALGIQKGQPFIVCKSKVEGKIRWTVTRQAQTSLPAPSGTVPVKLEYGSALTQCLVTATEAARKAEEHAAAQSNPVRFTSQDIQGLASTLFIQAAREGAVSFGGVV